LSLRLKRILGNLGISLAAAMVTPVFLALLSDQRPDGSFLAKVFLISLVYALAITFFADATLPSLLHRVAVKSSVVLYAILVPALVAVSAVGCAVGTAILFTFFPKLLYPWHGEFWPGFLYVLKLCVFITVVFGVAIATYERLRERLAATELKLRTEELERERAIKLATEARLAALQSRLHPHFLFNTLNSISSLIPADPDRAERLIERMAALLRFSLDVHRGGLVPLEQEMKIVRDYLEIEQARLGRRLTYFIETDPQLASLTVPPLSIQTLVENSIKYAIAPNREGGEIRVRAHRNNGYLQVQVADTGAGFSLETAPQGHGLDNLRGQLTALFGDAGSLTVGRADRWTTVTMKAPA